MVDETRSGYDAVAGAYVDQFADEFESKPFDRDVLDDFAQHVAGLGMVLDLGCGPGQVAGYLAAQGVPVVGVDLSPGMVAVAQQRHPRLDFQVGDMRDLAFGDRTLAGIAAFYSIIHIPRDEIPAVLAEQRRLLNPGGLLLLAFHEGDRVEHIDEFLGEPVSLDFVFFTRTEMEDYLDTAGFELVWGRQRRPYPDIEAQTERTYLLSRRPI
jgi:SAM-dependent methyltransferase